MGLVFLFVVAPFSLLAVFEFASAFNQNVSTWNTGAVTTMEKSKCTRSLSPSLCGHGAFRRGVLLSKGWSGHKSHTCCFWLWFETVPCCCCLCDGFGLSFLCGFGLSFLCCTLLSSCSVLFRICVQSGRVHLEYRGGDNYETQ